MHTDISYELAKSRIADLHRQAACERLARAAAAVPPHAPRPGRIRTLISRVVTTATSRGAHDVIHAS